MTEYSQSENSQPKSAYISLNQSLVLEVRNFLIREGMQCQFTQDGLVALIDILSTYKEEGKFLFPQMYIVDDLNLFARIVAPSKFHKIGEGLKHCQTMLEAVKKCAPLTEEGWAIYVLRLNRSFEYGVFKSGTNILSVPISEIILSKDAPLKPAVLIHQTSGKIVEVRGARANSIIASFSTQEKIEMSPLAFHRGCVERIIENVPEASKDQARTFFRKLFLEIMQKGHGTLIAVLRQTVDDFPEFLKDGIKLEEKIDIIEAIQQVSADETIAANSKIEGYFTLLKGMLSTDGVTVFANDGSIRGYNVFITHGIGEATRERFGGSRKRTYNTMKANLNNELIAVFMQSQDGNIQFDEHEK